MLKNNIKDILTSKENYSYIVDEANKLCLELKGEEEIAKMYAKAFNKKWYDHLPYEEYGFEDPYNFALEWGVGLEETGARLTYQFNESGEIVEVLD